MTDAVLNLCRVKMRDQQRLTRGPLPEYPNKEFGDAVPRAGNASGGGQPGAALRCAPGGPNDYVYVIIQPPCWEPLMKLVGREELIADPGYATPAARLPKIPECFSIIEQWTMTKTKMRGHGRAQRGRRAVRPDPVDEGHLRGQVDCTSATCWSSSTTRPAGATCRSACRSSCPNSPVEVQTLAAARRAHRRGAAMARLRRRRHRRDEAGRGGVELVLHTAIVSPLPMRERVASGAARRRVRVRHPQASPSHAAQRVPPSPASGRGVVSCAHDIDRKTRPPHSSRLRPAARPRPAQGPAGRARRRWPRCRRCSATARAAATC